jgi:hypothetical protein
MGLVGDLKMYGRFMASLPGFLRHPVSADQARVIVQRRLAERETNFLRLVERGIFGHPRSPYLPLLKAAGSEPGDIRAMLRTRGLEATLGALREAGVYVTFEEFKGREPIVRGGLTIPVRPQDFNNPHLRPAYQVESGGSTGAGTRVDTDLDHIADEAAYQSLTLDAHGVRGVPTALWRGVMPDSSGVNNLLRLAGCGVVADRWFSQLSARELRSSLKYRLATHGTVLIGRLAGIALPRPQVVGLDEAIVVARWAADSLRAHGACLVLTVVSRAVRVCVAAEAAGIDLTGATFWVGGEPPTPAKMKAIAQTGARYFSTYSFAEAGRVGVGCAHPVDPTDVHFLTDSFALVQHPRRVPGAEITVPAFHFTTLLPAAPKVLLNVEIDDYGTLEERACGCPLEAVGLTTHLREVRSFRKLTGEGVTVPGSEMIRILEEVLPARFGGTPLDYQFMEEEDPGGLTRLSLIVSPRVAIADEASVIAAVLEALGRGSSAADQARLIWSQAGALRVKRMEPIATARGKLMPLHLASRRPKAPG